MAMADKKLSKESKNEFLEVLKSRFLEHSARHEGISWDDVAERIENNPEKLWSLWQMEETGGEPDRGKVDSQTGQYIFYDCSSETPAGRRNLCYDYAALVGRKKHPPQNSADRVAREIGIFMLDEEEYAYLQTLGEFDLKTSSWLVTPDDVRKNGGAIFGDRRYDRVFTYHNGADSYYGARGFRGSLRV